MAPRRGPRPILHAVLVVALVLPGCITKSYPLPPGTSPTSTGDATNTTPPPPNLASNWSAYAGEFALVRMLIEVERFNETAQQDLRQSQPCSQVRYAYTLDVQNRTLKVAEWLYLHPAEPGPLRGILLLDLYFFRDGCPPISLVVGLNEGGELVAPCNAFDNATKVAGPPWLCSFPFNSPSTAENPFLWYNATFAWNASAEIGVNATVQGHAVDGAGGDAFSFVAHDPRKPWLRYTANVTVPAYEMWPYSSLQR